MASIEEQLDLERVMVRKGAETFDRNQKKAEENGRGAQTAYAQRLMQEFMQPLVSSLTEFLSEKKAGRNGRIKPLLRNCDPHKAMFMAMQALFNSFTHEGPLAGLATRIGRMVEDEARFTKFSELHGDYYAKIKADFARKGTKDYRYMHRVLTHKANEYNDQWVEWSVTSRAEIGIKLIDVILQNTDLIEKRQYTRKGKTHTALIPTQSARDWIDKHNEFSKFLFPDKMPCIVQPDDWTGLTQGGYYSPELRSTTPMIKTGSKRHKSYVEQADLSLTMEALNFLQSFQWEVNREVLSYVKAVWDKNLRIGMPPKEPLIIPPSPVHDKKGQVLTDEEQEAFTDWKHEAAEIYTQEKERLSKSFQCSRIIRLANEFSQHTRFWYVWYADFRGRAYPTTASFNPQGTDIAKGLLRLHAGKALGTERGWYWFRVQGANKFGNDKVSYNDRVQWVDDNQEYLLRAANDPFSHTDLWANADKPWQFLAWLFEYRDALALQSLGHSVHEFVSRLPVSLDGSCNGLQNFSALLRDEIGGAATNLLPSSRPADIYMRVAEVCTEKLRRIDDPMAEQWLAFCEKHGKVLENAAKKILPRSLAKRPVMTLPYGATRQSCTQYIFEALLSIDKGFFKGNFKASVWLCEHLWSSIGEVVVAARKAMKWLQDAAGAITKHGEPLQWKAADGFPVYQAVRKINSMKIETQLAGRFQLRVGHFTDELDPNRQRSGVSPNFIHTQDGSHMRAVIRRCKAEGISALAMIHDDFGTHAADTDKLQSIIRETFVELYTAHDALAEFKSAHEERGFALQDLPEHGTLDIQQVLQAEYFFG